MPVVPSAPLADLPRGQSTTMLYPLAVSAALLAAGLRPSTMVPAPSMVADTVPVASVGVAPSRGTSDGGERASAPVARPPAPAPRWGVVQTGAARGGPSADWSDEAAPARGPELVPLPEWTAAPNPFARRRAARPSATAPAPIPIADSIVVRKRAHQLVLYERGVPLRSYAVALGEPKGDKLYRGDNRTPEGLFHIVDRNPVSQYHLALKISYPDSAHRARAAALGRSPGGEIMIHGLPRAFANVGAAHREEDWTEGCIAVTNEEIEEIWRIVPIGVPIEIEP